MIYETDQGTYLFLYDSNDDVSAIADEWYESFIEAQEHCEIKYKVSEDNWIIIDEPKEQCLHDQIAPTRIVGIDQEKPEWGRFERLINGEWIEIKRDNGTKL